MEWFLLRFGERVVELMLGREGAFVAGLGVGVFVSLGWWPHAALLLGLSLFVKAAWERLPAPGVEGGTMKWR